MGSCKSARADLWARRFWAWALARSLWVIAAYCPGVDNVQADVLSRHPLSDRTEWSLPQSLFQRLVARWGLPEVDLFASALNNKVGQYVSWYPDPYALWLDAFSRSWGGKFVYCIPPFCLLGKCIQKLSRDRVRRAIVIVPEWKSQFWFPVIHSLMSDSLPFSSRKLFQPLDRNRRSFLDCRMLAVLVEHL